MLAATLRDAGVERMFGLPGGEILHFIEAARKVGIEFVLTRHEAVAALMADVTGQMSRQPGVCVSTLGPGAMNLTLGVANAYLDRSPMIAITATTAEASRPYATHQQLDLNAVFRPFTKDTVTLDGIDTAAKVRRAWRTALEPRPGPVHLALPSDVAAREERQTEDPSAIALEPDPLPPPSREALDQMAAEIGRARRPIVVLGLDLDPRATPAIVRRFVDALGVPVFVTPKAKGILAEDHPQFLGVCGGLAADGVVLEFFKRSDLLVGVGFEPVESDKLWHHTMKLVSIGPVSIAAGDYRPARRSDGRTSSSPLAALLAGGGPLRLDRDRPAAALSRGPRSARWLAIRALPTVCLRLRADPRPARSLPAGHDRLNRCRIDQASGLAGLARDRAADVPRVQRAVRHGLRAPGRDGRGVPRARSFCPLHDRRRRILGIVLRGDRDLRARALRFVTVVYNDSALSLIEVAQARNGYPDYGVRYGEVDFAAASAALGAWSRRVRTIPELEAAVRKGRGAGSPPPQKPTMSPPPWSIPGCRRN